MESATFVDNSDTQNTRYAALALAADYFRYRHEGLTPISKRRGESIAEGPYLTRKNSLVTFNSFITARRLLVEDAMISRYTVTKLVELNEEDANLLRRMR